MAYTINYSRPTIDEIRRKSKIPQEIQAQALRTQGSDARCQEVFDAIQLGLARTDAVSQDSIASKHWTSKHSTFSDGASLFESRDKKSGKLVGVNYHTKDAEFRLGTNVKGPDLDKLASGSWMAKLALSICDDDNILDTAKDFPGMKAPGVVYSKKISHGVSHTETVKLGGSRVLQDNISSYDGRFWKDTTEYLGNVVPEHEQQRQTSLAQDWLLR
jgi:hypothetical protein